MAKNSTKPFAAELVGPGNDPELKGHYMVVAHFKTEEEAKKYLEVTGTRERAESLGGTTRVEKDDGNKPEHEILTEAAE
jgi:hypothetical protein